MKAQGNALVVLHKSRDVGSNGRTRKNVLPEVGIAVIRENLLRDRLCDVGMQKLEFMSRPMSHKTFFLNPSITADSRKMCSTTRHLCLGIGNE